MPIELPIRVEPVRPMPPTESPYGQCGHCHYIGTEVILDGTCPVCGVHFSDGILCWPQPQMIELWEDEVFCWNHEKAELATVVAAMYFEASVFNLLYWATCWLDPDLNWIGAEHHEVREKSERIWRHLEGITNLEKTNEALKRIFGVDGKTMLQTVLKEDTEAFWQNYLNCRNWRNQIAHRGRRIYYATVPDHMKKHDVQVKEQALWASLVFIPHCWVVFSRLWNEYIHKRILKVDGIRVADRGGIL